MLSTFGPTTGSLAAPATASAAALAVSRFGMDGYVARATAAANAPFAQHKPPKFISPRIWSRHFRPFRGDISDMEGEMYRASYDLSRPPFTWDGDNPIGEDDSVVRYYYTWKGEPVLVHVDSQEGYPFIARGLVMLLNGPRGLTGIDLRNGMRNIESAPKARDFTFALRLQHPNFLMRGARLLTFQTKLTGDQWTVWRKGVRESFGIGSIFPI